MKNLLIKIIILKSYCSGVCKNNIDFIDLFGIIPTKLTDC